MPLDRRKYLRQSVKLSATLSVDSGDYYAVEVLNISLYGMQVQVDGWFIQQAIANAKQVTPRQPVNSRLKVDLPVAGKNAEKLELDCDIISLNRRSQSIYVVSLRYRDLKDTTTSFIETFVEQSV